MGFVKGKHEINRGNQYELEKLINKYMYASYYEIDSMIKRGEVDGQTY